MIFVFFFAQPVQGKDAAKAARKARSGCGERHSPARLMLTVLSYNQKRIAKLVDRGKETRVIINSLKGEKHGR